MSELPLDFDGKRDRWIGYNPDEFQTIVEEYEKVQQVRTRMIDM